MIGDSARRYPRISRQLYEQLLSVEPSCDISMEPNLGYRPCRVRLADGATHDRVYVQEARPWVDVWGVWPDEDSGKDEIRLSDVVEISSSPMRLPPHLATKIYDAGESGMGYCIFTLVLADGRRLSCVTGNAVDFVDLPQGVTPADVVDLLPREGSRDHYAESSSYAWCLYELPPLD